MEEMVKVRKDGPYLVKGPLKLVDSQGKETAIDKPVVALCRCGQSSQKPFCDGTHSKVGFQAEEGRLLPASAR